MKLLEFIVHTIGFSIFFSAVNYNRKPKIKAFSKEWWIIISMLIIGGVLVRINL
jgi:hypothetical protein